VVKRLLAATILIAGLATAALAQEAKQNFTLVNRTGYLLGELYVSPSKAGDWQEDILGDGTLEEGKSKNIKFSRSNRTCIWDLKVVYEDDNSSAVWHDIDLCKIEKITLKYNRSTEVTTALFD